VIDQNSRASIGGAIVSLQDDAGARLAVALTDELGNASLGAGVASGARRQIRVQRVGYASVMLPMPPITGDSAVSPRPASPSIELELTPQPLRLDAIRAVEERSRCVANPTDGSVSATLWAEVQKALMASLLTDAGRLHLTTWRYARTLDRMLRIVDETPQMRSPSSNAPFVTADPDLLSREGFVRPVNGVVTYFAPDAALLLSSAFARDHCFGVKTMPAASFLIGLSFEPIPGRDLPDVAGVLWLDKQTGELRWMDFHYTHVASVEETGAAAGRVDFASLPNGGWVTQLWYVRIPRLAHLEAQRLGSMSIAPHDTLIGYHEQGGWLGISDPGNQSTRGIAVLTGTVFDSIRGRPLAGVRVTLGGNAAEAATDSVGRYVLQSPLAGRYVVRFAHPRLALFRDSPLEREAVLSLGGTTSLDAATPSAAVARAQLCPASVMGVARGLLVLQVVDSGTGEPVRGARTRASWRATRIPSADSGLGAAAADSVLELETDAAGGAALCGLPLDEPLSVRVDRDGRRAERTLLHADGVTLGEVMITLGSSRTAAARIRGRVLTGRGTDARALPTAEVLVPSVGRSVGTNGNGEFALSNLADGAYTLIVRSIGYAPTMRRVMATETPDSGITVVLEPQATELERMLVTAPAERGKLRGFEERRVTNGGGHFITRDELAKRENSPLVDVLASVGVSQIIRGSDGSEWPVTQRGAVDFQHSGPQHNDCYYQLILDGVRTIADAPGKPPANLKDFAPRGIEAIEVYPGPATTPIQWGGLGATCGTIVIWTRR